MLSKNDVMASPPLSTNRHSPVKTLSKRKAPLSPKDSQERLGGILKTIRKAAGLNQVEVARLIGVDQPAYSRIESGSQGITIWQLAKLGHTYKIPIDTLAEGQVNLLRVSAEFGKMPPLPGRYQLLPHSRIRDLVPSLLFLSLTVGHAPAKKVIEELGLLGAIGLPPEQPIGVEAGLDLLRWMITARVLTSDSFSTLVDQTRESEANDFLHPVYSTQSTPLNLIQSLVLNSHHYEENFRYQVEAIDRASLEISVLPADHMREVGYKDDILGDMLCRLHREKLAQWPRYIGARPAQLKELACHFRGAHRCVYSITAA